MTNQMGKYIECYKNKDVKRKEAAINVQISDIGRKDRYKIVEKAINQCAEQNQKTKHRFQQKNKKKEKSQMGD